MGGSRKFCQRGPFLLSSMYFTEGRTYLPREAIGPIASIEGGRYQYF